MPAATASTASESYELWETAYSPDVVDDFINQAIMSATGWVYDPITNPDITSYPHTAYMGMGSR